MLKHLWNRLLTLVFGKDPEPSYSDGEWDGDPDAVPSAYPERG